MQSNYVYRPQYCRRRPHVQPPGATLFVTFRLADSIPQYLLQQWLHEQEQALATADTCNDNRIRTLVRDEKELERIVRYVLYNPVKAGLASDWKEWPGNYSRYGEL